MLHEGYKVKILNTINFKKSMHYNPFAYIHSEKDILKLVTTLIANTKGEGKTGDDFWVKAETLLYPLHTGKRQGPAWPVDCSSGTDHDHRQAPRRPIYRQTVPRSDGWD
jgi:hypothetical protein